jgi:hypothetical protein
VAKSKSLEILTNKLITAKSILQCVAAAMDSESQAARPDEPSWAMEAAGDLIGEVIGTGELNNSNAWMLICQAKSVLDAAIAAHDSQSREIELFHVLSVVVDTLDRASLAFERKPRSKPRPRSAAVLRVVPTAADPDQPEEVRL